MKKFCVECRWARSEGAYKPLYLCTHSTSLLPGTTDPVTGEIEPSQQVSCSIVRRWERDLDGKEWCGPDGKFWEQRDIAPGGFVGFGEALRDDR